MYLAISVVKYFMAVIMITNTIVKNAITIYQHLNLKHEMPIVELLAISGIESIEFYRAIGWLVLEGCVSIIIKEENKLIILTTNL